MCVCLGEMPHFVSGDVLIDIDDRELLIPEQVKQSCQLAGLIISTVTINEYCLYTDCDFSYVP